LGGLLTRYLLTTHPLLSILGTAHARHCAPIGRLHDRDPPSLYANIFLQLEIEPPVFWWFPRSQKRHPLSPHDPENVFKEYPLSSTYFTPTPLRLSSTHSSSHPLLLSTSYPLPSAELSWHRLSLLLYRYYPSTPLTWLAAVSMC
jgi:hypothetical protein